jgi:arsenite methyltransferase
MDPVKGTHSVINRPGGFLITDRALNFCSFRKGATILDLGCGSGATVDYLIENYGFEAFGIDKNLDAIQPNTNLVKALAEEIPFSANSMNGVFMECSLSLMDYPEKVLKECYRILKTDGRLIVSDLYARGEASQLKGFLGYIDTKKSLISKIESSGFLIDYFEDFTEYLHAMWGQMIFEKGTQSLYSDLGANIKLLKQIKCGYCLVVATRKEQSR